MTTPVLEVLLALFSTPMVVLHVPDAAGLNAILVDEAHTFRRHSPGQHRSNRNGWHSYDDFFDRQEPGCRALQYFIFDALRQGTLGIAPSFDFTTQNVQVEGWVNINGRGGFNAPHDHPGWAWSGCYYVTAPSGDTSSSGCIEFLDTRTNLQIPTIKGAACYQSKYLVQPKPGMLLLFPSWLKHWTYPNENNADRISVAFNARFVKSK